MLIENAVNLTYNPIIDNAVKYIKENYTSEITIKKLCDAIHVSKNVLYENFHNAFGNTVNAYICEYRINKAKKLLADTDDPIYTISEKIGINNNAYFCRQFKKITGFTPTEFRKRNS